MEEESPIQSLPNELLLAIFGRIQEAEVLLDGIALVCKRWNALARESKAWSSVTLVVNEGLPRRNVVTDREKRVLQHAPALGVLQLSEGYWLEPPISAQLLLLRAPRIGALCVSWCDWDDDASASAVLALLWRSRRHLQEVTMDSLYGHDFCLCADRGEGRSLLDVLAAMPQLRRLHLTNLMLDCGSNEAAGPVGPLPQLQELSVHLYEETPFSACTLALIRATAPSLHALSLTFFGPATAELEAALRLCVGLRRVVFYLCGELPPLAALAAWTSLERLELVYVVLQESQLDEFLKCCAMIVSLQRLVVNELCVEGDFDLRRCRQHLGAFRRARPTVSVTVTISEHWHGYQEL